MRQQLLQIASCDIPLEQDVCFLLKGILLEQWWLFLSFLWCCQTLVRDITYTGFNFDQSFPQNNCFTTIAIGFPTDTIDSISCKVIYIQYINIRPKFKILPVTQPVSIVHYTDHSWLKTGINQQFPTSSPKQKKQKNKILTIIRLVNVSTFLFVLRNDNWLST